MNKLRFGLIILTVGCLLAAVFSLASIRIVSSANLAILYNSLEVRFLNRKAKGQTVFESPAASFIAIPVFKLDLNLQGQTCLTLRSKNFVEVLVDVYISFDIDQAQKQQISTLYTLYRNQYMQYLQYKVRSQAFRLAFSLEEEQISIELAKAFSALKVTFFKVRTVNIGALRLNKNASEIKQTLSSKSLQIQTLKSKVQNLQTVSSLIPASLAQPTPLNQIFLKFKLIQQAIQQQWALTDLNKAINIKSITSQQILAIESCKNLGQEVLMKLALYYQWFYESDDWKVGSLQNN